MLTEAFLWVLLYLPKSLYRKKAGLVKLHFVLHLLVGEI